MADLTVTAASVLFTSGSSPLTGTAGETITAGMPVYLKSSDGKLWKALATAAASADAVGISLHAALAGQPLSYAPTGATINVGATTSKATAYMVSATAGGIAPQADLVSTNKIVYLGYATDAVGAFVVKIANTGVAV